MNTEHHNVTRPSRSWSVGRSGDLHGARSLVKTVMVTATATRRRRKFRLFSNANGLRHPWLQWRSADSRRCCTRSTINLCPFFVVSRSRCLRFSVRHDGRLRLGRWLVGFQFHEGGLLRRWVYDPPLRV